ncbi:phosphonoacetaldehyde hydrolase [Eubacterium sp. 1001713B170207_170306_E7]|uniref:phosphonoacetaldehyde hydrolase n=1 Tax=Eubacterium sp. 1001713B170207_170306_E7 TaxID=2787097 RepID=UPI00189AE663|nr:phosphonoacetaldehyde hydrolase [Eubacterium sp. 1001713B170207_170306_E7]
MKKIEAVIFDWAGTTIDYGCFAPVQAFMEVFKGFGIEPTIEETRKPMGMLKRDHIRTMMDMLRISSLWQEKYGRSYTEEDIDAMYAQFEEKLMSILDQFADPKPHVLDIVAELRGLGLKIGSTTGYTDEMMAVVTRIAAAKGYAPDCWYSPNAVENYGRPYPFMLFKNLETLGVHSVHNAVKIGDTVSDILEGKNAGVVSIGVVCGSSEMGLTEDEFNQLCDDDKAAAINRVTKTFRDAGADYVIQDLSELIPLIKTLDEK